MLRQSRLEHEGERIFELRRRRGRARRRYEGLRVRPMRQHRVVQRHAARFEARALRVIAPKISPMNSLITFIWNHGGRNVCFRDLPALAGR